jgi:hypothetical protein
MCTRWLNWTRWSACLLLLALVGLRANQAQAGSGGVTVLPQPGTLNTSGVKLVVDSHWVDGSGYRPVRVEIIPLKAPAVADRQFRVVVKPQSYYGGGMRDAISQIIELEQGALKATASIPVPQDVPWHALMIDVYEDGRMHDDLSGDSLSWPNGNNWNWNEGTPSVLAIDARAPTLNQREALLQVLRGQGEAAAKKLYDEKLPDIRNLVRRFHENNQQTGSYVTDQRSKESYSLDFFNELKDTVKSDILPPQELPERWIEFSSIDLIIISLADLADMAKQRPKTLRALGEWTRSGQTLIVYNTGEEFAGLPQLEKLLQLPPRPNADSAKYRGWREPVKKIRGDSLRGFVDNNGNNYPRAAYASVSSADPTLNVEQPGAGDVDQAWPFVLRPAGMGNIIAFAKDPFPGSKKDWDWALNSLPGISWNPSQRTGASQQQRNEDFWNFLIPGTGQAPVMSFLVFITLFVVIIGPVNYYMLQSRRRLYMMLITVPIGAFLVTLGLFMYAMFTDGLGVKSRLRSYTTLDQRAGLAQSTSRQAYYASLAPSRGLMFEDDTVVIPYLHEPTTRQGQRAMRRVVNWSDHDQQLKSGYLSSRSLSQLLVTKSAATKAKLRIGQVMGDQLPVTNELEATLSYLLVKDAEGKYFTGTNIKAGATQLTEIESEDAAKELSKRLHLFKPDFPEGYDEQMHDSQFDIFNFGPRYYGRWGNSNPTAQANSLLERKLARFGHLGSQPLEVRTYVAIADGSPVVPLGAPRTRQYSSLHVIEGSY